MDSAFIGWSLYNIRFVVEVFICLRVDKWDTSCRIFPVFQRFYLLYIAAVPGKTSDSKITLIEDLVQFFAKQLTMIYDSVLNMIFISKILESSCKLRVMHFPVCNTSHDVKVQFCCSVVLVIFPDAMNESVKTMPVVHFGYTDKVDPVLFLRMGRSDGYAVKVYAIGYTTGLLSEDR